MTAIKELLQVYKGAEEVHRALDRRYHNDPRRARRYVVVHEVRSHLGFDARRVCDALVVCCWPSDGLRLLGIEVKVSRGDWLRELKQPAKAEEFSQFCHEWWVAVGNPDVAKLDELPPGWGLLVPSRGGELRAVRTASQNTPAAPSHSLLVSIARSVAEQELDFRIKDAVEEARKEQRQQANHELERAAEENKRLIQMIAGFEDRSGVKISTWDWGPQADAVKLLLAIKGGGYRSLAGTMEQARTAVAAALKGLEEAIASAAQVDQAMQGAHSEAKP